MQTMSEITRENYDMAYVLLQLPPRGSSRLLSLSKRFGLFSFNSNQKVCESVFPEDQHQFRLIAFCN